MEVRENAKKTAWFLRQECKALIITSGAGMGVDSGLPDFRGDQGFWKAYPMYQKLGINFMGAANPRHFSQDPALGWGFYGHRLNLYRQTLPHAGFGLLLQWVQAFKLEAFVVTSNVDGQFQKAGFGEENLWEVHGSIHHLQCSKPCHGGIEPNQLEVEVDLASMRAKKIPLCSRCQAPLRPNILMFGDWNWLDQRSQKQEENFYAFLRRHQSSPLLVLEIGAGKAVPTIRHLTEELAQRPQALVCRINPREAEIWAPHLSLECGGLEGLQALDTALREG